MCKDTSRSSNGKRQPSSPSIGAVLIATMYFKVTKLDQLAQIALGRSGSKTKMNDDGF